MKTFMLPKKNKDGTIDIVEVALYSEINEIRLDDQTVIRVGYDECKIKDGVIPNKVLASGVINKSYNLSDEFNEISFVVISDFAPEQ
jgi:hypothetical protein